MLDSPYIMREARVEEHDEIARLAKTSPYTRDFTNRVMFSSDAAYAKGWIRVLIKDKKIIGFYCIRNKVRGDRATKLYFITVHPDWRGKGVGEMLMLALMEQARRHGGVIELDVAKDNRAKSFYDRHGFRVEHGEALGGAAWRMRWDAPASVSL